MSEEFWRDNEEGYNRELGMRQNLQENIKPQLNSSAPFQFDSYVCEQCQYVPKDNQDLSNHRISTQHNFTLVDKILTPTLYNKEWYKVGDKDLYSLFIEKFGLEAWLQHVEMECIQYLWRARDKGQYREDINKVKVICERILLEIKDTI